ncbi:hypothetical protein SEA_BIGGITYBASS_68 [Gordonia phage BiggityBass]|nr:hypothetical protein SEA_BIGGITYBASS_68 [Gordonia phage BiggityBass]
MPDLGQTSSPIRDALVYSISQSREQPARYGPYSGHIADEILANPALHIDLMSEHVTETRRMGEWQDRARRVINAVNALLDADVTTDRGLALARIRKVMVDQDFRDE